MGEDYQNMQIYALSRYHNLFKIIDHVRRECAKPKFLTDGKPDYTKRRMFVDFMTFKLDAINDHFIQLIEDAEDATSNQHLKGLIGDCMTTIVEDYMNATKMTFLKNGIPYKDADFVIELFEDWRKPVIKTVGETIKEVFASDYYDTKYDHLKASLEIVSIAVALIPHDGLGAFDSMNGRFRSTKYKSNR